MLVTTTISKVSIYRPLNGDWEVPTNSLGMLWRRYTEFEQLRAYLEVTYVWAIIPPLPEKRPTYTWHNSPSDTFDPDFIDRRRVGLEVNNLTFKIVLV